MIATSLKRWVGTTKALPRNPRALLVFAFLYALLLASLYAFAATREATVWQVAITLLLLVLIPVEFFVLQSAIVTHTLTREFHWGEILRNAVKLLVVTIPIILLGYVLWVLLNKWQAHYPPPVITFPVPPGPAKSPTHWPTLFFSTLRSLFFGVALPLATIHLWIEVASHDLRELFSGGVQAILKRLGSIFARALAPDSVLPYALGLILFAAIPYAALFVPISARGTKTAFAFFIGQLIIAFVFTLIGWVVTVGALAGADHPTTSAAAPSELQAEAAA